MSSRGYTLVDHTGRPIGVIDLSTTWDRSNPLGLPTVTALARVSGKTGVEMEALTAASVACLTIYDMAKAVDRGMTISGLRLVEKTGGKSGDYRAAP